MKNYFKKMSLLLAVSSTIALTSSIGAFAAEDYVTGVNNLNSTAQNSAVVGSGLSNPEKGWIRFNQDNSNIAYTGFIREFQGTNEIAGIDNTIKFNFVGNQIRLIAARYPQKYNIEISIDGKVQTFNENSSNGSLEQSSIVFEKRGLTDGEHTVVIRNLVQASINLDAIDISAGGQLKPYGIRTGVQLLQPEAGWTRFNDDNTNLTYGGNWSQYAGYKQSGKNGDTIKFNFTGNKIRLIGMMLPSTGCIGEISIDGKAQTFNEFSYSFRGLIVVFENLNLSDGEHSVVITSKVNTSALYIDSIDISDDGELKPYTEAINPAKVGDKLPQPEAGWVRFNQDDSNITYDGHNWCRMEYFGETNGTSRYKDFYNYDAKNGVTAGCNAKFNFVGNKLRIVGFQGINASGKLQISIDGKTEPFNENKFQIDQYGILVYENLGLEDGEHNVVIQNNALGSLIIDAIDINDGGKLKPYTGEVATDVTTKVGEIPVATTTSAAIKATV